MKINNITEPLLDFGTNTHICPRAGISNFSVYDSRLKIRREKVYIGGIGTSDNLSNLNAWIEKCSDVIPAADGKRQPNLFPSFCGVHSDNGYKSQLIIDEEITRSITGSELRKILKISDRKKRVVEAVNLYYRHAKFLAQNRTVDVIVCVIPTSLYEKIGPTRLKQAEEKIEETEEALELEKMEYNFRRALKAKSMHLGKPIQLVLEKSLNPKEKGRQDEATKAWNFCTAIYYKANRTVPWKLITNINRPSVCFVGISFYRSRDRTTLNTSLAQIFDELGQNVILRGNPVDFDETDRQPHLTEDQAYTLLSRALDEYRIATGSSPSRLVIHKSSTYTDVEIEGFEAAADDMNVQSIDFITILDSNFRLLRGKDYPVARGTHLEFNSSRHLLYTCGSVEFYKTYPGKYIPQPLEIRLVKADESSGVICKEILGLTKMNWNNTQFDGKYPITLTCSRKVGQIMKYLGPEDDEPQSSYGFYM